MAVPINIDAAHAIDILALPYDTTQDANDSGTTYELWYKYTAVAGDIVVSVNAFGDLIAYSPEVFVYDDAGITFYLGGFDAFNVPLQMPVEVGHTYYFQILSGGGDVTPAILTLHVESHAGQVIPTGSFFINDDIEGFPLAVLSATTGAVLAFFQPVVHGEYGQALNSGEILLDQAATGGVRNFYLYDSGLNLVATITGFPFTASDGLVASDKTTKFYIGSEGTAGAPPPSVTTVDPTTGALGLTTWTLTGSTGLRAMQVNTANTILYFVESGTANLPIKRWDLVGNVALANLVAGLANYQGGRSMLVLNDGTIIYGYSRNGFDYIVKHYSAAGAVLNTYSFPESNKGQAIDNRLAYALDDPTSFWVLLHVEQGAGDGDKFSRIENIRVVDGVVLASFDAPEFEGGVATINPTATPALFGHSESCTFFLSAASVSGSLTISKVTSPSPDPTDASFTFTIDPDISGGPFLLKDGESHSFPSIAVGDYAVTETVPNSAWTQVASLAVDGGAPSPFTNPLSIVSGRDYDLIFTNTYTPPVPPTEIVVDRRLRRATHLSNEQLWNFYSYFQLDLQAGIGLTSGQGSDPQVVLRWSDDGGHTWSREHIISVGRRGDYRHRAIWRRLGRSRDRIFEVYMSDPVKWVLLDAFLGLQPGTS